MVEFSRHNDGFQEGIRFEVFKPHKQPRTWIGRVIRFFSNNSYLVDGFWYPAEDYYTTPYEMAIAYCNDIITREAQYNTLEEAWKNLDETP